MEPISLYKSMEDGNLLLIFVIIFITRIRRRRIFRITCKRLKVKSYNITRRKLTFHVTSAHCEIQNANRERRKKLIPQ